MSNTNFENQTVPSTNKPALYKNIIIAVLALCLIGLGAYTITNKNEAVTQIQQKQVEIAKVTDEKSDVQKNFDASLARLDSMSTVSTNLEHKLTAKNSEIGRMKSEIRSILNKKNASVAELGRAKKLIDELNGKITGMEADIARLTDENKGLNEDKVVLTKDKEKLTEDLVTTNTAKQALEKKVDIASTLNASNIKVTPINVKGNGKEKISTTAKRIDKLLISFDVDNRIAPAGSTDLFVLITGPDGKTMQTNLGANGTFTSRADGEKSFTVKVPVELETDKRKNVAFAFTPGATFQQGSYKIQIYQNGFLIGEGAAELKKGGLFS